MEINDCLITGIFKILIVLMHRYFDIGFISLSNAYFVPITSARLCKLLQLYDLLLALFYSELIIIFLFVVTAAGVVPCGIPKKRPRTSSIVQFIFYFWSFEISRNVLRNHKTLSV